MDAYQFCAEYGNELQSGRITFRLPVVKTFIKTYTYLEFDDFTDENIKRLRLYMIDLYNNGLSSYSRREENPADKIELPSFVI